MYSAFSSALPNIYLIPISTKEITDTILPIACNAPIILFASLLLLLSAVSVVSVSEGSKSEGVIVEPARRVCVFVADFWYFVDSIMQLDTSFLELA